MHLNPRIVYVQSAQKSDHASQLLKNADTFCREIKNSGVDALMLQLCFTATDEDFSHHLQKLHYVSLVVDQPCQDAKVTAVNEQRALAYLQALQPDVLIFNQLDATTTAMVLAARQLHIPVVLDYSGCTDLSQLAITPLARALLSGCSELWVNCAKHRQALLSAKVPATLVHALPVLSREGMLRYIAASTGQLWQILRRHSGNPALNATVNNGQRVQPDVRRLAAKQLRVVAIMDEFTRGCYEPEAQLLHLHPDDVVAQLEQFQPELFFIESAWKGLHDAWKMKVSNRAAELMLAIAWCRLHRVPVVFWNKEDPVHFSTFLPVAAAADYVFTTDVDCVPRYKQALGHDQVGLLPFAAQTKQHNPLELFERKDAFNFAGSYYLRYPERQRDFAALIDTVQQFRPVDIYDRNHENPHPHYQFPQQYKPLILGSLPFEQIDKAYKGYRYGINMNTIKQSQTMFARRVFELLASNTVVVSNFSRGVRTLFGDLVICSDDAGQLQQRLAQVCADETSYRKFRLLGLRKVMQQHTYRHRLAYICSKVFGIDLNAQLQPVTLLAVANDASQMAAVIASFRRQLHPNKQLLLLLTKAELSLTDTQIKDTQIQIVYSVAKMLSATSGQQDGYQAFLSADDYYGPHYLTDLVLATYYSPVPVIGKASFYRQDAAAVVNDGQQYHVVPELALRRALVPARLVEASLIQQFVKDPQLAQIQGAELLAIDEFNYCSDVTPQVVMTDIAARVDDVAMNLQGTDLEQMLLPLAEKLPAAVVQPLLDMNNNSMLTTLKAAQLKALLPAQLAPGLTTRTGNKRLSFAIQQASDQFVYVYLNKKFSRAALNLVTNSQFQLLVENCQGDVRTVFEYWSADNKKLAHSINRDPGEKHTLAIPGECQTVRFGLRLQGNCQLDVLQLVLGSVPELPAAVMGAHRCLVLTKQYPAYDDLYRYGFLHSRVRAYRELGLGVDVFRLVRPEAIGYCEFENIDVVSGSESLLDATLANGQYRHVLVHLLDQKMWQVLKKHLDKVKVTIWVHGAEIQVWQRREYEFERMAAAEVIRQKKLSQHRVRLWKEVLEQPHPNLQLVFVSQYFADESFTDIGVTVSPDRYRIIHNFIDGDLFRYQPKPASQRLKLLSIRPYASRKYANDLTIQAILLLANQPFFTELEFCLVGDGELFDELTAPLQPFDNVRLIKRFMNHAEIAALHQQYGVFLTPTRMDSQGVSRDEAMASGLVPITTAVAAIPEFVDSQCGFVVPAEDAQAIADAVVALYQSPELFSRLSAAAAARVRAQSGFEQTVNEEYLLIKENF